MMNITQMNETKAVRERAILVAVDFERGLMEAERSLEELKELADTAGADTVAMMIQKRERPHQALYIGTGKIEEIALLIDETKATMLIADDELSPSQIRNLGEKLGIKVVDRTVIILDIFAARANSKEGKIQVELAQQKYRLSHLSGMGVQLSRLGGGIGTRGPGEKKLETDKRHIREIITNLNEELAQIEKHRTVLRKNNEKKGIPVVSMVGYTNAGKSTLFNRVSDAGVFAEDMLFATLDTTTRRIRLPGGSFVQFTDTVGFINKLPHGLIKAFRATLDELRYADILVHVVDASDEDYRCYMAVVAEVLRELGCGNKPMITVYNKIDLCDALLPEQGRGNAAVVSVSAKEGTGIDSLLEAIEDVLKQMRKRARFQIPYTEGGLISLIHGKAEVISEAHEADGVLIEAFVPEEVLGKLARYALEQ